MARKKKVGRPKMAKNTQKQGFPLRLRPALIKEIEEDANEQGKKKGLYVEEILEDAMGFTKWGYPKEP